MNTTTPATEMGIEPLVERVARAMADDLSKRHYGIDRGPEDAWEAQTDYGRDEWRHAARAAIAAFEATRTPEAAQLTPAFKAMPPLQKWETLVLSGLIGTDEPWIEDVRDALREQAAQVEMLREALERYGRVRAFVRSGGTSEGLSRACRGRVIGMSAPAFTPAPWSLHENTGNITRDIVGADGRAVCSVWNLRHHMLKDPTADTNLILAAPELYSALHELVATSYSSPEWQDVCTNAMDALAKARGEQS